MALAFPLTIDTRPATQDRVLWLGDSFIEWFGNHGGLGGGLFAPLSAEIHRHQLHVGVRQDQLIPFVQDGKSGTGIGDIAVNVNARVIAHNPTIIFLLCSRNDVPPNGWLTDAATLFNAVDAALPTVRVCIISELGGFDERWDSVLGWDPTIGHNDQIATLNGLAQTFVAGRDPTRYVYADLRGTTLGVANTVLNYEQLHNFAPVVGNTVGVSTGILLNASGHPIAGEGQAAIGSMFLNKFLNVVY